MKLSDIHIGVSPLTDRIYLGTVSKRDPGTWTQKEDCTSQFIAAVMCWAPAGSIRIVRDSHGNQYEIEVRIVNQEKSHER